MKGNIFAIQHYAVHDGPGIRTLVFLKGCLLNCDWCCNPESHSPQPQLRYIPFRCRLCYRCLPACPVQAITVNDEQLVHDFEQCRECPGKPCTDACPYDALTITGRTVEAGELFDIIARDIPFYRNSGGGVTFSGGEPFHQAPFLLEMLKRCREAGIHTAVETCGWANHADIAAARSLTDLFLFDLKIINPDNHLRHVGKPVAPILENLAYLASHHPEVIIRFPLVPGITDTPENLEDIVAVMKKNSLTRINLEPYHSLGVDKYEEHGLKYSLENLGHYQSGDLEKYREFFAGQGLQCEVV